MNQPFFAEFPDGEVPAATPLLVVCRAGEVTVPPPAAAELPQSAITAALSETYKFGPGGVELTFDQAEFPVQADTVTARWYTADGFYVVGYDGVDLSATGPLCPGSSIETTPASFEFLTNDPTDDASGICGNLTNLAGPAAGVQACGDLLVYITEIPTSATGTLWGTLEIVSDDGTIIGMTSTVQSDVAATPTIDIAALCS